MLITQGHEYVTEGEKVIENSNGDKILNSSKLLLTVLFFNNIWFLSVQHTSSRVGPRYQPSSYICFFVS